MNRVTLRDSQKTRALDVRLLKRIARTLLKDVLNLDGAEIGFDFVSNGRMAEINQKCLGHAGATDVITFAYSDRNQPIHGDILICVEVALLQAKEFKTLWSHEVVRYMVHGLLHLLGEDDLTPAQRRKMKAREESLVRELARRFAFREIERL